MRNYIGFHRLKYHHYMSLKELAENCAEVNDRKVDDYT